MSKLSEIELNEARDNNPLWLMAVRMADVVERWGSKPIDIDKDGFRLIADYLLAIGLEPEFSVRPKRPATPPDNFGE